MYAGRNMKGVRRGEIKKLLVLESLPKPVNYTGGMEPLSYGGTFTLERAVGTVPSGGITPKGLELGSWPFGKRNRAPAAKRGQPSARMGAPGAGGQRKRGESSHGLAGIRWCSGAPRR